MEVRLVMTIIGRDKPGLVDLLASIVGGHGGNWLESRMSRLGGQFAGILRVLVPQEREEELIAALKELEPQGLRVMVQSEREAHAQLEKAEAVMEIVGQDRPGIVRQISNVLARYGVNVIELHTECQSAAMSGETLFTARAQLEIPESCDVDQLRRELEKIAADLFADISFESVEEDWQKPQRR